MGRSLYDCGVRRIAVFSLRIRGLRPVSGGGWSLDGGVIVTSGVMWISQELNKSISQ